MTLLKLFKLRLQSYVKKIKEIRRIKCHQKKLIVMKKLNLSEKNLEQNGIILILNNFLKAIINSIGNARENSIVISIK